MPHHDASEDVEVNAADAKQWSAAFSAQATGTPVPESQVHRLEQLARTAGSSSDPDACAHAMTTAIHGMAAIGPQNELEGMLVSQMIATHENAMKCQFFAAESLGHPEDRDREMRYSARFMQIFTRQVDALIKLRASDLFENYQGLRSQTNPYQPTTRERGSSPG
jgi:hypothetical protein